MTTLLRDKIDWVIPKIKGKEVLDLGCVRHSLDETEKDDWLHGLIVKNARDVVGVDYLAPEVAALKEKGYQVVCANVETMALDRRFEVVVAGDLIEHLNNFGNFLERVSAHLKDEGTLLLTTPNPINPLRFVAVGMKGYVGANREHTCWFTANVLAQLAARYDLKVKEEAYVDDSAQYYRSGKWKGLVWLNSMACRARPEFAETLCLELVKA